MWAASGINAAKLLVDPKTLESARKRVQGCMPVLVTHVDGAEAVLDIAEQRVVHHAQLEQTRLQELVEFEVDFTVVVAQPARRKPPRPA